MPGPKSKNPVAIAQKLATPGEVTYNNPLAIADANGSVHFLFCLEYARCFYLRSDDDGATFTPPVEITAASLQFVRKVSGFRAPSRANQAAFDAAVRQIADVTAHLLDDILHKSARPPPTRS